jgi:hypothetical protein
MKTLDRMGFLAAIVCTGALGPWGCVAGEESEEVGEDDAALKTHDRQGGPKPTSHDCMDGCRSMLGVCLDGCDGLPKGEQQWCRQGCADGYLACTKECQGLANGGGFCLNSHDCYGLPDWSNP